MPWVKLDDKFHSHPKVMELELPEIGLWTLAASWCADYLTDGEVKKGQIRRLGGTYDLAQKLVEAGLWEPVEGGWQFRDWTEYQPTREAVEAKRDAESEGGSKGNHTRWHVGRGVVSDDCEFCIAEKSPPQSGEHRVPDRVNVGPASANHPPEPVPLINNPSSANAHDDEFTEWWQHYPKKVDKGRAKKAFKAARKKVSLEKLTEAAQMYAQSTRNTEKQYIKNPATWLGAEAWDNEDISPTSKPLKGATPSQPTANNPGAFTNWDEDDYRPWHSRPHVVEAQERVDAAREQGETPSDGDLRTIAGPDGN